MIITAVMFSVVTLEDMSLSVMFLKYELLQYFLLGDINISITNNCINSNWSYIQQNYQNHTSLWNPTEPTPLKSMQIYSSVIIKYTLILLTTTISSMILPLILYSVLWYFTNRDDIINHPSNILHASV